ncbi:hypothetical protein Tco_0735112 [Tanacetum coccineum]
MHILNDLSFFCTNTLTAPDPPASNPREEMGHMEDFVGSSFRLGQTHSSTSRTTGSLIDNATLATAPVIQNGNSKKRISTGKNGVVRILPPVSVAEIYAVEKERKARTILLMAIPKEHLRRFHGMDDAKEIWEAIRTSLEFRRVGIKGYDRLQQTTLTVGSPCKSSTNKVKSGHTCAYSTYTPTSSNNIQDREVPVGFADEVIYSVFAKQSEDLDLLHEDLE